MEFSKLSKRHMHGGRTRMSSGNRRHWGRVLACHGALLTMLAVAACAGPDETASSDEEDQAEEFNAEEYFAGQRVTINVGSSPGGGYDLTARTFAQYLPEHLPGSPSVVVQNIPQGAHLLALQTTTDAEPDGYTVGMMAPRWTLPFVLGVEVEGVDFENAQYIGSATGGARSQVTCFPRELATSWDEIQDQGLTIVSGGSEAGTMSGIVHGWLQNQGYPVEKVLGYGGTAEADEALRRGEINAQGLCQSANSAFRYPEWEGDYWAPLWRVGLEEPEQELIDLIEQMGTEMPPPLGELVDLSEEAELAFETVTRVDAYNRMFFLPPGTPDEVLDVWVQAFEDITTDPEFVQTMKDVSGLEVIPVAGDVIKQTFLDLRQEIEDSGLREEIIEIVELEQLE